MYSTYSTLTNPIHFKFLPKKAINTNGSNLLFYMYYYDSFMPVTVLTQM